MSTNKLTKRFTILRGSSQPFMLWRIASMLLVGFLVACCIGSAYFMYSYVYRTLEDANVVIILGSTPDVEVLNDSLYGKARILVNLKMNATTTTVPMPLRNIFDYGHTSSTNPNVTSSKK